MNIGSVLFLLANLCFFSVFGQTKTGGVSMELSIPHSRELPRLDIGSGFYKTYILVHNDTDHTNYFLEDRCSHGHYNITFEIKYNDSVYTVRRAKKLWYGNHFMYHQVLPGETLVFEYSIIDSTFAAQSEDYTISGDGWLGFPDCSDTVEIRAVYRLNDLRDTVSWENIGRLNYNRRDYTDYLDGDIDSPILVDSVRTENPDDYKILGVSAIVDSVVEREVYQANLNDSIPALSTGSKPKPEPKPVIIFHEPLVSEWQKVILLR